LRPGCRPRAPAAAAPRLVLHVRAALAVARHVTLELALVSAGRAPQRKHARRRQLSCRRRGYARATRAAERAAAGCAARARTRSRWQGVAQRSVCARVPCLASLRRRERAEQQ
jgi:hypothetical protein